MRKTTWILLGILIMLGGAAVYERSVGFIHMKRLLRGSHVPVVVDAVPGQVRLTPEQMLMARRSRFHLAPDSRFVLALNIVAKFPAKLTEPVMPHFGNGAWLVSLPDGEVSIPELPTFEQAVGILRQQAGRTLARISLGAHETKPMPISFEPGTLLKQLAELNAQANDALSPALLRTAAGVECRLAFSTPDLSETADILPARCLALTVLAESASGEQDPEKLSMAATSLGYITDAISLAANLPEDHPWRAYLERNDDLLNRHSPDEYSSYLQIRRLASQQKMESWTKKINVAGDTPSLHTLATFYSFNEHGTVIRLGLTMPSLLWKTLTTQPPPGAAGKATNAAGAGDKKDIDPQQADLLAALDAEISRAGNSFTGPFFDANDHRAVYRAYLYSGLYAAAEAALYLRDVKAEAEAIQVMVAASKTAEAVQFAHWYRHLIDAKYGKADTKALRADLLQITAFGEPMVEKTATALNAQYELSSTMAADILESYAKRLDTRHPDRIVVANIASSRFEINLSDRLLRSIALEDPLGQPSASAWADDHFEDWDKLKLLATDKRLPSYTRTAAMEYLEAGGSYDPQIVEELLHLIKDAPDDWAPRKRLVRYYAKHNKLIEARETAAEWVRYAQASANVDPFGYWGGIIELSDVYLRLGDKHNAMTTILPLLETNYGGASEQAVKVLLQLGRIDLANKVASQRLERYPDSLDALAGLLEVGWEGGFYGEVARVLKQRKLTSQWFAWREHVGVPFARALGQKPEEAHQALDALIQARLDPWYLQTLPDRVAASGNPQLAFDLQLKLTGQGMRQIPTDLRAYGYLKEAAGEERALGWLKERLQRVPPDFVASAALMELGNGELLWSYADPSLAQYPSSIWLYRASAYITGYPTSKEQLEEISKYYQSADETDRYNLFGKYLMGYVNEERISRLALDKRGLSEAAFYLGLGAARNGRYRDMVDWMCVSLDTHDEMNGEYRWAARYLLNWSSSKSIEALAQRKSLF